VLVSLYVKYVNNLGTQTHMQNTQHAYTLNGPFYFYTTHAEGFLHILATDLHSKILDIT